ncbi:hypothetical protein C7B82_08385 [Stenomitos frigidus ULC18]|uniref:Uncharacterized protein n=1 Tax=Stenomitos frigidus ULC18 TaxID=2107698 RepID=A0A2T1ED55_9CYAN|nr:hypothetical protein C7B82_08385 [Stenomitos frigidus ULC18]
MVFYLIPAALVFSTALQAFLEDESTPKTHFDSWIMLIMASLLWPITLPSIMSGLRSSAAAERKSPYQASQSLISLGEK